MRGLPEKFLEAKPQKKSFETGLTESSNQRNLHKLTPTSCRRRFGRVTRRHRVRKAVARWTLPLSRFAKKFWTTSVVAKGFWPHGINPRLLRSRRMNWKCLNMPWLNSRRSSSATSKMRWNLKAAGAEICDTHHASRFGAPC